MLVPLCGRKDQNSQEHTNAKNRWRAIHANKKFSNLIHNENDASKSEFPDFSCGVASFHDPGPIFTRSFFLDAFDDLCPTQKNKASISVRVSLKDRRRSPMFLVYPMYVLSAFTL